MGETIFFDFNKKKRIDEKEQVEISKKDTKRQEMDNEDPEIKKLAEPFLKFVKFVISDKYKKFQNLETTELSYDQARETVKKYSNKELISWLTDHDESEWVAKPSFFKAVFYEMKERVPDSIKGNLKKSD